MKKRIKKSLLSVTVFTALFSGVSSSFVPFIPNSNIQKVSAQSISWGAWQPISLGTVNTGGLWAAAVAAAITGYTGLSYMNALSAAYAVVATSADRIRITGRLRYGTEGIYSLYQRELYLHDADTGAYITSTWESRKSRQ